MLIVLSTKLETLFGSRQGGDRGEQERGAMGGDRVFLVYLVCLSPADNVCT